MKVYLKDWVMHKIKVYGYCQEETHEGHLNMTGVNFSGYKFEHKSNTF